MTSLPLRPLAGTLMAMALLWPPLPLAAQEAAATTETAASEPEAALPAITVSEVATRALRDRVVASGLVAAIEEVQVQPLVEGQAIEELLADVGDHVEAGQVLARLQTSSLDLERSELAAQRASVAAQVAQAEATLIEASASADEAERVARRNDELLAQGTISQAAADQAEATAAAARARARAAEQGIALAQAQGELVEAQIATLELQVARTEVKAPVAGLVIARNAQVGAIASAAGDAMFTIVRDGAMEMRAELSEQDLLRVAPGQPATFTAIGSVAPLAGTVRLVEPTIDPATRLGQARITIDDPSRVVEGMFLTAEILVGEDESLAVPATAVGAGPDGASVFVVRDGVVERVPVTTGIRDGTMIGLGGDIAAGDLVVTKAAAFVRDGDRINPVLEAAPEALAQAGGSDAP